LPYPHDQTAPPVPAAEALDAAALLRGGGIKTAEDLGCCLCVLAYGCWVLFGPGRPPAPPPGSRTPALSREAAATLLETFGKSGDQAAAGVLSTGVFPWRPVLTPVAALLLQYLHPGD